MSKAEAAAKSAGGAKHAGGAAAKAAGAASKAGTAAASAAKVAAGKAATGKAVLYGGSLLAFAGRRALWPGFVIGSAFGGAFMFGVFDATLSFTRLLMPVPSDPDRSARNAGYATVPVVIAIGSAAGWHTSPALAAAPTSVVDMQGLFRFATSLPLRHLGIVGASSAAAAAVTCRVVQYRGGA